MKDLIIIISILILIIVLVFIYSKDKNKHTKKYFGDTLRKTGHPLLELYHNSKPYLLLLDTGATHNVIDSNSINEFDKKFTRKYANLVSGIGDVDSEMKYEMYKIRFDDKINSFTDDFISMDLSNTFDDYNGKKVVGILGVGFLSKYALTLDFKNNIVS